MHEQVSIDKIAESASSPLEQDRYYVQPLTERIFLVRERVSADHEPGNGDRLVRSFEMRHDAYMYATFINDTQRKLDERYGRWIQNAV